MTRERARAMLKKFHEAEAEKNEKQAIRWEKMAAISSLPSDAASEKIRKEQIQGLREIAKSHRKLAATLE